MANWSIKNSQDDIIIKKLAESLSVSKTFAKILVNRGITNYNQAKKFFRPSKKDLHNPFLMKGMKKAVSRIETAIVNNENILIYGDYDVDGTTAVSLVYSYLKKFYKNISTYIPDRYNEGYGISLNGIDFAKKNNFSLIIALDCGIKAVDKIDQANKKNIDFIICDHHNPGKKIPNAIAVLNPKQKKCKYPYKELCGCGVGFKLIQAFNKKKNYDIYKYLDLVAIAIAADIVPITGENRVLAYYGLKVLNSSPRNGIKAIINKQNKNKLTITDVVFTIAPKINAAGRIYNGNFAVKLLTETNLIEAEKFAIEIDDFNNKRKILDKQITIGALKQIKSNKETEKFTTVVFNENWHKGVIGIVASRLIETYYRPTVVFTKSNDKLTASVRSVKGFNVYNALEKCSDLIEQFGGHKYAAGLTILSKNYNKFKLKFESVVKKTISEQLKTPEINIDDIIKLNNINQKFFRIIKQMEPFGPENMKPTFLTNFVKDNGFAMKIGKDKKHLKLKVYDSSSKISYEAIGFGMSDKINKTENEFNIVYTIEENNWKEKKSIQLNLKDLN